MKPHEPEAHAKQGIAAPRLRFGFVSGLAARSIDGSLNLWDAVLGNKISEWPLPGPVHSGAFTVDGRHLVTGNGNGTVYILRLATGKCAARTP